jgi:hypothetical protein
VSEGEPPPQRPEGIGRYGRRQTLEGEGTYYDFSKSFGEQIQDYKKGKFPTYDSLIVSGTPKLLQRIGLNALPITYTTGHLKVVLDGKTADHDFGEAVLKRIPEAIKDPIAVIDTQSKDAAPGSLVVIVGIKNPNNNREIIAAIVIDGHGRLNGKRVDSNVITTIHSRKAAEKMLAAAIKSESAHQNGLYYWDKKRAVSLLSQRARVQFPGGPTLTDGFIRSIHDAGSKVNTRLKNVTESLQFKRWFGESTATNPDGTPKTMYYAAETKGAGAPKPDSAGLIVLTANEQEAARTGEPVEAVYVRATNPVNIESRATLRTDITAEKVKAWKRSGYDSIYIRDENGVHLAVFNATQIKSARDNLGTYDRMNPDINYALDSEPVNTGKVLETRDREDVNEAMNGALEGRIGWQGDENALAERLLQPNQIPAPPQL